MSRDKSKRRLTRVGRLLEFSLKRFAAEKRSILLANTINSPLLRLPDEIRNRIYLHVLGNKTLHIDFCYSENSAPVICQAPRTHKEAAKRIITTGREIGFPSSQREHMSCVARSTGTAPPENILSLALLQVCQQVHSEAALLPSATNTFAFEEVAGVGTLVEKLISEQARTVSSLAVASQGVELAPKKRHLAKLPGLRNITILAGIQPTRLSRAESMALFATSLQRRLPRGNRSTGKAL